MNTNFWQLVPRPILALAPMVGITNSAFRRIARGWGADVVYTEMISADALVHKSKKTIWMLDHDRAELPLVAQLMGKDPSVLAAAAHIVEASGVSGVDINFGCPAHKIAKNFCGAMLMRDLDRCRMLIDAVCSAVSIPVSIKVRISIQKDRSRRDVAGPSEITILDFFEKISDLPLSAIMIHGRSFEDPFDGGVRPDLIRAVVEKFHNGPVLANGGITTIESSKEFLQDTGAAGLGLARSVIGKPWVFKQIRDYLTTGVYEAMPWESVKNALLSHVELFEATRGTTPFRDIRRHLPHYIKGHLGASQLRQKLVMANSPADVVSALTTI